MSETFMVFDMQKDKRDKNKVDLLVKYGEIVLKQFKQYHYFLKDFKSSLRDGHWGDSIYYFSFDPKNDDKIIGFAHTRKNLETKIIDLLTLITENKRETKTDCQAVPKYKNAGKNLMNKIISDHPEIKSIYIPEVKDTAEGFYQKIGFKKVVPKIISYELNMEKKEIPKVTKKSRRLSFSNHFSVGGS